MTGDYRGREPFDQQRDPLDEAFRNMRRAEVIGFVAVVILAAVAGVFAAVAAGLVRW